MRRVIFIFTERAAWKGGGGGGGGRCQSFFLPYSSLVVRGVYGILDLLRREGGYEETQILRSELSPVCSDRIHDFVRDI